jgi:hypothetical protein
MFAPKDPPPPIPPPNPATFASAQNSAASTKARLPGATPTILTSGMGVTSPALTTGKTVLGF